MTLQYGPIAHVDLKIPPRPPGYAFVEVSFCLKNFIHLLVMSFIWCQNNLQFEEARDAADAMRGRDGYDFDGHRLRVGYIYISRKTYHTITC